MRKRMTRVLSAANKGYPDGYVAFPLNVTVTMDPLPETLMMLAYKSGVDVTR